ncbi:MAG TPA: potassium transporter Kup [Caldimonas sp.]|jgi:KUP system potassium uptake protein|nr:potassium transporter Kup [Caldimonas sp.]HEX4235577.1 potassium transporter Kup [Caldimonas sp.]
MSASAPTTPPGSPGATHGAAGQPFALLALAALGIVYGDIGTSPLYVMKTVFAREGGLALGESDLAGVLSLILWSLMIVVTLKYVLLIMRADNRGEGGIMALLALASSSVAGRPRLQHVLLMLGVFGAALFYGDGVVTPAISVLSAVEGLEVASPRLAPYVLELTVTVLVALFLFQKRGTAGIGALFGPVMVVWFVVIAIAAIPAIARHPAILAAVDPLLGLSFLARHGWVAFVALGSVVLAVTGAEALYADMGHFGAGPIRLSWFTLVLPALALNYLGQGALLAVEPAALDNPFFKLFPAWALLPMVVLSTVATVIASQAVISGAYSMTNQAMQLGFLPRLRVEHTSEHEVGQIFVPAVNNALLVAVLAAVVGFGSSTALGAAYGIAVTGTMLITTLLTFFVVRNTWHYSVWLALAATAFFVAIDIAFFSANLLKVAEGGWFPLVIGTCAFTAMATWASGRLLVHNHLRADAIELEPFLKAVLADQPMRAPGTAVFMNAIPSLTPTALLHNLKHNHVLHQSNLFVTVETLQVPWVSDKERASIEPIVERCFTVLLRYGFKDRIDVPAALDRLGQGIEVEPMTTSYFLSRATVVPTFAVGMSPWREKLFASMHRNETAASDFFNLPPNRVVELGAKVQI